MRKMFRRGMAPLSGLVLLVSGCSAGGGASSPPDAAEPVPEVTEAVEEPAPEPTVESIVVPDPCSILSAQEIADAAGVGAFGSPRQIEDPTYESDEGRRYCVLSFSDEARAPLGIETGRVAGTDATIKVSAYNGGVWSSGGNSWTDTDPDSLLSTYLAANQEQIGSNATAQWVPGSGDRMIQDGSTVVAVVDDRYWVEVTLFMCHYNDCGPAALSITQALTARLAAS